MRPFHLLCCFVGVSALAVSVTALSGCSSQSTSPDASGAAGLGGYNDQSTATMLATISVNPDATNFVFAGAVAGSNGGDMTKNLFALDLKTLRVTRLTTTDECQSDPAYSFDGTKIAYISRAHENEPSNVFICDANGTHARQVTTVPNVEDHHPAFSRDGSRIVFSRSNRFIPDSRGEDTWTDLDTYTIKVDGTGEQKLTDGKYNGVIRPAFYPDGKRVLFEQTVVGAKYNSIMHICQVSLPGEKVTSPMPVFDAVKSSDKDFCPFFYPDGEHIVFSSSLDSIGHPALRRYDLATHTNVLLHPTPDIGADKCPVVTADGKQIYFLRGYGANIWVLDTATNAAHQVADGSIFDNPLGWKPSR